MTFLRICAQLIDIIFSIVVFVISFILMVNPMSQYLGHLLGGFVVLAFSLSLIFIFQLPFLTQYQTIGKAFFKLKVESTDKQRPLTMSILLQREIFCKLASCYIICIPVLFGKIGGQDIISKTVVVHK